MSCRTNHCALPLASAALAGLLDKDRDAAAVSQTGWQIRGSNDR